MTFWQILRFWLPLAAMWFMMSLEHSIIAAVIARLPNAELNLAAFGLTFALALIIESPVIMLLTAGTALARDRRSYGTLIRFTSLLALVMTLVHLALAFSPRVYAWILVDIVGAPEAVAELSRMGFLAMAAWTGAIAFRRLWQGVMIRYNRPRAASLTTVFRIAALGSVSLILLQGGWLPGAAAGGLALSVGVIAGLLAARVLVRPTLLTLPDPAGHSGTDFLTHSALLRFYTPLALTSFIVLGGQPLLSFGLGRAFDGMRALAVWPVISALLFMIRSGGFAYQEVAVALLARPSALPGLRRFTATLALVLSALLAIIALSPLAGLWLTRVAELPPPLAEAARLPLILLIPAPGLTVLVSWFRGRLVDAGRTPAITRAVAINLATLGLVVVVGLARFDPPGAALAATAMSLSLLAEIGWLWRGVRSAPTAAPPTLVVAP